MKNKFIKKFISVIATTALLFNSLAPSMTVLAQEITPSPSPTASATPTDTSSPTPTDTPTAIPSPTDTYTPTVTPVDTTTPVPTDTATPASTLTPAPTATDTATPTVSPTDTATPQVQGTNDQNNNQATNPPSTNPTVTPTVTPTATPAAPKETGTLSTTTVNGIDLSGITGLNSNVPGQGTITTNQADYSPTSLVLITGTGFIANKTYTIEITSANPPPVDFTDQVKADSTGKISYAYQLDGNYRPNYTAYIKDGTVVVATVTFTDTASGISLDQYSNAGGSPGWQHGDLNSNNSSYREGDSVPFRLTMTGASGSSSVTIGWQTTNSPSMHAYDYLTTYNRTVNPNPCVGGACSGSPTTYSIPADTFTLQNSCGFTGSQIAGSFNIWGGTITSVSAYGLTGCASTSTNTDNTITINFTATSSNVVIAWAGHIASQLDWGLGHSASSIQGSPYHMLLDSCSFNCGDQDRALQANGVLPTPGLSTQISLSAITLGQSVTDTATLTKPQGDNNTISGTVSFYECGPTGSATPCTSTSNQVGSAVTISSSQATSTTFTPNSTGTYCFAAYYTPDSNAQYSPTYSTSTTNECVTVTNPPTGTITLNKTWSGTAGQTTLNIGTAAGASDTASQLTGTNGGAPLTTGTKTVNTGTYYVSESGGLTNYTAALACTDNGSPVTPGANNSVTVSSNHAIVCTFTNTRNTGTIQVTKDVTPDDFGATSWDINISGPTTNSATLLDDQSTSIYTSDTGSYTISESAHSGTNAANYTSTYSCLNGQTTVTSGSGTSASLNLTTGQNVVCKFTNTRNTSDLKVKKVVDDGSPLSDWGFSLDGANDIYADPVTGIADLGQVTTNVTHTITEGGANGSNYTLVSVTGSPVSCSQSGATSGTVNIPNGTASTTCTFTNNVNKATVNVIKYNDLNADGTNESEPVLSGWTMNLKGQTSQVTNASGSASFTNLFPGTYTLTENLQNSWNQSNISCDNGSGSYDSVHQSFTFSVLAGQTVNCSIGNYQNANLTVTKTVIDPNGASTTDTTNFGFTAAGNNFNLQNGQSQSFSVKPGTYAVSETQNTNYTLVRCTNLSAGQITLTSGQSATVACTNQQKTATITVVKSVVGSDGKTPEVDGHQFQVTVNGQTQTFAEGTNAVFTVNPGTYSASESADINYTLLSNSGPVTVGSNGSATIYITNEQDPGTISGHKFESDGTTPISGWTVNLLNCATAYANCSQVGTTTTNTNGFYSFTNLLSGFYQVVENLESTYTPVGNTSYNVTVGANTNSTVNNFSNFKNINITVCKKSDADGNLATTGDQSNVLGWGMTLYSDGKQLGDSQTTGDNGCVTFSNLGPNHDYSVTEENRTGWTNLVPLTHDFGTPVDGKPQNYTFYNQQLGKIIIDKVTNPSGAKQSFDFSLTGGASQLDQTFSLVDGGSHDSGYVLPGSSYVASETLPSGWDQTSAICDNESSVGNITVNAGQTVTCTFTNTEHAHITVNKITDPANDPTSFDINMTTQNGQVIGDTTDGSISTNSPDTFEVTPGTYSVSETIPTGWTQGDNNCSSVTVTAGQSVSCNIYNTKDGQVIVTKYLDDNANGNFDNGEQVLSGWTINLSGNGSQVTGNDGTTTFANVVPGSLTLSENLQDGWNQSNINCDNGDYNGDTQKYSLNVAPGTTVNCSIGNYQNGQITVNKVVTDPNGNVTDDTKQFNFNVLGVNVGYNNSAWIAGGSSQNFTSLKPGTYNVSEETDDNYNFQGCVAKYEGNEIGNQINNGEQVTVTSGDTVVVTCTNQQQQGSVSGTKWNDANENGVYDENESGLSGWTIYADLNGNGQLDNGEPSTTTDSNGNYTLNLNPGTYSICEVMQSGWQQTYPGNETQCHDNIQIYSGQEYDGSLDFGNFLIPVPNLVIAKSNDKSSGISAGSTVTYTITVNNSGNTSVTNLKVTDVLPGGFSYVLGTSTLNGSAVSDPTQSGNTLSWNVGTLATSATATITYQALSASDLSNGTYTNFVTCTANYREESTTNCNTANSNVTIGNGTSYGGNVVGQVLGASTELPGTGSPTGLLFAAVGIIAMGFALKMYNSKKGSKHAKN